MLKNIVFGKKEKEKNSAATAPITNVAPKKSVHSRFNFWDETSKVVKVTDVLVQTTNKHNATEYRNRTILEHNIN